MRYVIAALLCIVFGGTLFPLFGLTDMLDAPTILLVAPITIALSVMIVGLCAIFAAGEELPEKTP